MKDRFMLMYIKNNKAYPVIISDIQVEILQSILPVVFNGEAVKILDKSMGEVTTHRGTKKEKG